MSADNSSLRMTYAVTTNTRSFTDINGRPTFAVELLTIEEPNFTANTEFAGSRPTGTAGTGDAMPGHVVSMWCSVVCMLALTVAFA